MKVKKSLKRCVMGLALLLVGTQSAHAHPHVFVDYQMKLVFDSQKMRGIQAHWQLDLMNSELILDEFDKNKDGRITGTEAKEVAQSMRDNLKGFDYFTQIQVNGHRIPVRSVENIRVGYQNKRITYDLYFPCAIPLSKQHKQLTVTPIDSTNYVAFSPMKSRPVHVQAAKNTAVRVVSHPKQMYDSTRFTIARK